MASCKALDSTNTITNFTQRLDANTAATVVLAEVTLAAAAAEEATLAAAEVDTAVVVEVDMAAVEEASAAVTRCLSLVPVSSSKHGVSSIHDSSRQRY